MNREMRPNQGLRPFPANTGKKGLLLAAAVIVLACLPACNTVRGVGEDMAAVGNTLARAGQ
jgi:predicted small secreted protein